MNTESNVTKYSGRFPLWTLGGGLLLCLATAPSCKSDKGGCEKYFTMAKKCIKDMPIKESKAKFLKECKKDKDTRKIAAKCGKASGCSKFVECVGKAFADGVDKAMEDMEKNRAKELSKLLAAKKWEKFLLECFMYSKKLRPDAKKVCETGQIAYVNTGVAKTATDEYRTKVRRWCATNESVFGGKGVGAVCESVKVSDAVAKVDKTIKENKLLIVPFACEMVIEALEKSKHANAKANKARLLKACYVKLGVVILDKMLKKSAKTCTIGGEKLYKAVKKHQLKDPRLDPLMEKAKAACEKK